MPDKILELVLFELNDGVSQEELMRTVEPVTRWLGDRPGFLGRELSYDAEGDRWVDLVRWASLADAKRAAELAVTCDTCRQMFALIDMDRVLMLHGEPARNHMRSA